MTARCPDRAALFIPLKGEYFDAFERGEKVIEYRLYSNRWNERTCRVGRPVVLSRGYGRRRRLRGEVSAFWTSTEPSEAFRACYPKVKNPTVACIQVKLAPFPGVDIDAAHGVKRG